MEECSSTEVHPEFELRWGEERVSFVLLALSAFLPSLNFFTQNKGEGGWAHQASPLDRSTTNSAICLILCFSVPKDLGGTPNKAAEVII